MTRGGALSVIFIFLSVGAYFYVQESQQIGAYQLWKQEYGLFYPSHQDLYRELIFHANLAIIEKHNANSSHSYKMGVNQFTAMSDSEVVGLLLRPRPNPNKDKKDLQIGSIPARAEIDWTSKGKVSPVKDQGFCGSCWAFGAVGVLESWALIKGQKVDLSEQQLVDCSKSYGNQGCNGGLHYQALLYVQDHGLATQNEYPYTQRDQKCKFQGGSFTINHRMLSQGCTNMQNALMSQPVSVAVDATNWAKYHSGIFSDCGNDLNHDVLLVGMLLWSYKIKNSWGTRWGEQGYIRMSLGNTCGICDDQTAWVQ